MRRWDDTIDDARLAFESCDDDTSALNPDSAQTKKKHLRRLEAIISAARARADAMQRDDVRDSAFFFRVRKTLAEALDARALGLVTVSAVGEAASSAREALDILTRDLGYPEGDSLTIALERARVAALELACGDDGSSRKREKHAMALLRRARLVLTAALGGGTDDAAFSKTSLSFSLRSDSACSSCAGRVPRATCAVRGGRVAGVAFRARRRSERGRRNRRVVRARLKPLYFS
jgi:hypothetical protein